MQEEEIIYEDIQISEVPNAATVEEVIPVITITESETFDVEMFEAFPAYGEIDALNHALLNNRELNDAHPIASITGLRAELDSIEALQTIYSDKKGNADYYEWADGHALGENGVGYFVTLNRDTRTISICTGDDIFGVVVPDAAFVGGQDEVARDAHYGLVATSGAVHVMCELDVVEGDYVVANEHGKATKSTSGRGYKVVAQHNINGVPHATINLNISADQMDLMGAELQSLDSRMDAAESNIVSAVNVANEAYQKASEMIVVSTDASNKAQDALDTSNKVLESVGSLENAASQSQIISAQAKAIAEGAMVSAESMKNEALEEANKALQEATELKREFEADISEIEAELDSSLEKLQQGIENIEGARDELQSNIDGLSLELENTQKTLQSNIDNIDKELGTLQLDVNSVSEKADQAIKDSDEVKTDIEELENDLEPLVMWPDAENPTGIAGFVAKANENSVTLGELVKWQTDTNTAIAGFKQEVADTYATIESLSALETETSKSISTITQRTDANESSIKGLTSWKGEAVTSIANVEQKANSNESNITLLANWQSDVKDDVESIATIEATANENASALSAVASYEKDGKTGLAGLVAQVDENKSSISALAGFDGNLAGLQAQVDENTASVETLTSWKSDVEDEVSSITSIKQQADANKASIASITAWQGTTEQSIAKVQQQASANAASITSLTEWKGTTDRSISSIEQRVDDAESSISSLTSWQGTANTSIAAVTQKANANESSISSLASWKSEVESDVSSIASIKSTADANKASIEQLTEKDTELSQTIAGVKSTADANKASINNITAWQSNVDPTISSVASIKQTADANKASIEQLTEKDTELSQTIAGVKATADANKASIESITSWQSKVDPTINSVAGIKQTADANKASIEGLTTWQGTTNTTMARIEQKTDANGASLQTLVANINKYSVGTCSQSNGFSLEQAQSVLEVGIIHVPTENHTESSPASRTFMKTYYYTWDGSKWATSSATAVYHSDSYQTGNANSPYWYIPGSSNVIKDGITYNSHTLYKWESYKDQGGATQSHWVAVATLEGNSQNRSVSQIRQDTNSVVAEVTDARGNSASLSAKISDTDSKVNTVATWQSGAETRLAAVEQKANDNGASIGLVVTDGKVNGSIVVEAINGTTGATIKADHINLNGAVTANNNVTISTDGKITAKAGEISGLTMSNQKLYGIGGGNQYTNTNGQSYPFDHVMGINSVYSAAKNSYTAFWVGAKFPRKNATPGDTNSWGEVDLEGMHNTFGADDYALAEKYITGATDVNSAGGANLRIDHQGHLFARDATIIGDITATNIAATGTGTIGGWTLADGNLTIKEVGDPYCFHIRSQSLNASRGIGGLNSRSWRLIVGDKFGVTDTGGMAASSGVIGGWSIDSNSLNDNNIYFYSKNQEAGTSIGNSDNLKTWRIKAGNNFGVTSDGSLYASAADITGTIRGSQIIGGSFYAESNNGDSVSVGEGWQTLMIASSDFDTTQNTGHALKIFSNGLKYVDATTRQEPAELAIEFQYYEGDYRPILHGYWYVQQLSSHTPTTVTSDINKKNTINLVSDVYSKMFDVLKPITFKYNDGTSDRLHLGLGAQDTEEAILSAGLTTKDCAIVCYDIDENGNKINYGVRYEELVALNIYEIQKLKARVAELEAKLTELTD